MGNAEYMGSFIKTMAQQGASLQNYNNELVKCLEDLREKREAINREIAREEDDKNKIQNDLKILTERLSRINDSLARKVAAHNEYDQSIQETEAAYLKILESSQTLLHVLKRESANLQKKSQASSQVLGVLCRTQSLGLPGRNLRGIIVGTLLQ